MYSDKLSEIQETERERADRIWPILKAGVAFLDSELLDLYRTAGVEERNNLILVGFWKNSTM